MSEVCKDCGKIHKRIDLGIACDGGELDGIKVLQNQIGCSQQALNVVPKGISQEDMDKYIHSVLEFKANAQWLQNEWWNDMLKKYELRKLTDKNIFIDFQIGMFYTQEVEEIEKTKEE